MFRFATILGLLTLLSGCSAKVPSSSADASPLRMTATVVSYEPNSEWDHFDDGSFATYDTLTLKIESTGNNERESLAISVSPTDLPNDSPFRIAGTRITFTLDDPISSDVHLAWGALKYPKVAK